MVTGAGRGLGKAIALRLASEGADLVLASRDLVELGSTAREVEAFGRAAAVVPLDLREPGASETAVFAAQDRFGRIDVLVANSGVAGPTAPLWEVDQQAFEETFAVNVTGVFATCRAVVPGMIDRGQGSVVVIGSMTGKRPLVHRSAYAASKAALIGLVRTAAVDLGPHGIRINLVSPGPVRGPRLDAVLAAQAAATGDTPDGARRALEQTAPLRRTAAPEDVAAAVAYLASDEAAGTTGEDLNVSCGTATY